MNDHDKPPDDSPDKPTTGETVDEGDGEVFLPFTEAVRNCLRAPELVVGPRAPLLLGRFAPLRPCGNSGQGKVYVAWDYKLNRFVALKFLKDLSSPLAERFREEARATSGLPAAHVVRNHDYNDAIPGRPFIIMEYAAGGTIERLIPAWQANPRLFVEKFLPVVEMVNAAHQQGLVHRDLKPDNILLDAPLEPPHPAPEPGEAPPAIPEPAAFTPAQLAAKVTDWGLAARHGAGAGQRCGTSTFAAPEQWDGNDHPKVDQFGLGATAYFLLTGDVAVRAEGGQLGRRRAEEWYKPPPDPRRLKKPTVKAIDADLAAILMKTLALNPGDRYTSTDALAQDLRRYLGRRPVEANRFRGRVRKWVQRNRTWAIPFAFVTLAALLAVAWAGWTRMQGLQAEAVAGRRGETAAVRLLAQDGDWTKAAPRYDALILQQKAADDPADGLRLRVERLTGLLAANRVPEFDAELDDLAARPDLGPLAAVVRAYQAERLSWAPDATDAAVVTTAGEAVAQFQAAPAPGADAPVGWDAAEAYAAALAVPAPGGRLDALREATKAHPFFFPLRRTLLLTLVGFGRFPEAEQELHFCRDHFPETPAAEFAEKAIAALRRKDDGLASKPPQFAAEWPPAEREAAASLFVELSAGARAVNQLRMPADDPGFFLGLFPAWHVRQAVNGIVGNGAAVEKASKTLFPRLALPYGAFRPVVEMFHAFEYYGLCVDGANPQRLAEAEQALADAYARCPDGLYLMLRCLVRVVGDVNRQATFRGPEDVHRFAEPVGWMDEASQSATVLPDVTLVYRTHVVVLLAGLAELRFDPDLSLAAKDRFRQAVDRTVRIGRERKDERPDVCRAVAIGMTQAVEQVYEAKVWKTDTADGKKRLGDRKEEVVRLFEPLFTDWAADEPANPWPWWLKARAERWADFNPWSVEATLNRVRQRDPRFPDLDAALSDIEKKKMEWISPK